MKFTFILTSIWIGYCFSYLNPAIAIQPTNINNNKASFNYNTNDASLASTLNQVIRHYNRKMTIGVSIKSMHYGDTLYTYNAHKLFIPASTIKILTAETALIYLGHHYRFTTQLCTDAPFIRNGTLFGNLYIIFSGDPSLTYDHIISLFTTLKARHIHTISGNIYIDNAAYDKNSYAPGWNRQDISYCYSAPISTGMVNRNCLSFRIIPNKIGRYAKILRSHNFFYPIIKNAVMTKKWNKICTVHLSTNALNVTSIAGCIPHGHCPIDIHYVIPNTPSYNHHLIKQLLAHLSIRVRGHIAFKSAPKQSNMTLLSTHRSPPLSSLINAMLKKSDNIVAGTLFKKIGELYIGQPGNWQKGYFAVLDILFRQINMDTTGIRILDGSGLSRYNAISPTQMMQLLEFAYHRPGPQNILLTALPISGIDGTLKHRLTHISGKVYAKTGTLSGVASLVGYAINQNQEPIAFAIMINGQKHHQYQYKLIEDRIVTLIAQSKRI